MLARTRKLRRLSRAAVRLRHSHANPIWVATRACCSPTLATMSLDLHSHRTQLVLTALGAAAITAGAFSGYQQYVKHQKRRSLNQDIHRSLKAGVKGKQKDLLHEDDHHPEIHLGGVEVNNGVPLEYDEELVREQLARNYAFFGDEGMARIRKSTVAIIGCGGVGSWAAVMLARSCVSRFLSATLIPEVHIGGSRSSVS